MTWPEAVVELVKAYGWPLIAVVVLVFSLAAVVYVVKVVGGGGKQVVSEASKVATDVGGAIARVLETQATHTEILRNVADSIKDVARAFERRDR